jgi:hypothetical protein
MTENKGSATLASALWVIVGAGLTYGVVSTVIKVTALFGG